MEIILILFSIILINKTYKKYKKNKIKKYYNAYKSNIDNSSTTNIKTYYTSPVLSGTNNWYATGENKTQKYENKLLRQDTDRIMQIQTPKIIQEKQEHLADVKQPENYFFVGVKKEYIIVKEELEFYLKLKKITDKYDFHIFPFMRVADIIKTKDDTIEFNKIGSRHIDFTIVDKYTKPLLFIELDGASHNKWKQKIRDQKKDYIFKTINEFVYRINLSEMNEKLIEIDEYLKYVYVNQLYKIHK